MGTGGPCLYTPLTKMESSSGGGSADSTFVGAGGLHVDVPLRVVAVPGAIQHAVGIVRLRTHLWNTPNTPVISPSATRPSFQETSLPRLKISCAYNRSKNTIRSKCHSLTDDGPPTPNQAWLTTEWLSTNPKSIIIINNFCIALFSGVPKLTALYNILQHFLTFTNRIHIIMATNNV